jgi:hypothetical protein
VEAVHLEGTESADLVRGFGQRARPKRPLRRCQRGVSLQRGHAGLQRGVSECARWTHPLREAKERGLKCVNVIL